ncbi:N-acetyl sugar amidotransferase [Magnetospirillum aberrantis]|uniref:Imidazole glycerol phosphate synthase subunit HisF n=1 Tax=Magnetospirillum aberrantis SpK TaxID=908842 RepID=A0A7C9QR36_9PROT|nr:N-acetyl sugar amidotransferase [Magnetospirillum aberrantis]NFV78563.1 imidazole glycerol phosphate synthase subunit HisF [Magnetospirillum aberrantis SpK]
MSMPRLIVCLLVKNGMIVRSESFLRHQIIGNPISTVARLSNWNVDELVILDISEQDYHDMRRDDLAIRQGGDDTTLGLLRRIATVTCMPLSFGGRIGSIEDIRARLEAGADKCVINTAAFERPELIREAAEQFGSQCVVVSIDARRHEDGRLEAFVDRGRKATGLTPAELARKVEALGAGEIFLNSIDRDGAANGYDLELVKSVTEAVRIPVIACGGVGRYEDFAPGVTEGQASAVAAANIFHFFELAYPYAKRACIEAGLDMRKVALNSRWFPREPVYDVEAETARINDRLERAKANLGPRSILSNRPPKVRYCRSCLYPSSSATYMEFDEHGVCMGCRQSNTKFEYPPEEWERRRQLLIDILEKHRCPYGSRHDCVIGVSGGKDSYFQAHYIKSLGFNPLLVTYFGNNYTEVGLRNLYRMKDVLGLDHVVVYPSVQTLKKLNRLGLIVMGDMNWHAHIGIGTTPMREAVLRGIPLVIWGEHGEMDLSGQFSMNDMLERTYRYRLERDARGYEWNYMVGREGLTAQDMSLWTYPSDQQIYDLGLKILFLSNYTLWEGNDNLKVSQELYGFEVPDISFERTYRKGSNLDDMHENGMHDYLKYIKFGYGRCTDHATKDIRAGKMTRARGVELVRQYDHVKSSDLKRWLEYVGMSEAEFDAIADTFRDPRVWWRGENGAWAKDNIWDEDFGS